MRTKKNQLEKACNGQMTLKVCSNKDCIFNRYRDRPIATFTLYVAACDLEKSFVSVEINFTSHASLPIHAST